VYEITMKIVLLDEEKMAHYAQEERHIREENLRLQRKLQMEMERRESLCRHLSESESSLEMDDERYYLSPLKSCTDIVNCWNFFSNLNHVSLCRICIS
jgi:hypothetical protein